MSIEGEIVPPVPVIREVPLLSTFGHHPIIALKSVSNRYDVNVPYVSNVSFCIKPDELLCLCTTQLEKTHSLCM